MIVHGALIPHTPLLLPTIGGNAHHELTSTLESMARLKESIERHMPDTIVLIKTPEKGRRKKNALHIQLPQKYVAEFSQFGDLITREEFTCDTVLAAELKDELRRADIPISSVSKESLEYTASIGLVTLCAKLPVKVVVLQPPQTDLDTLFSFGQHLTDVLQKSPKKIVVLAAGDGAHCSKKGKKEKYEHICLPFDYMFNDAVQKKSSTALLSTNREEMTTLNACAVEPAVVLRGILDSLSWTANMLSYEAPFGVGYSVIEFSV
ncbi:MAG: hypothetical protein AAB855_03995 [Patescibacteria group bacterium]